MPAAALVAAFAWSLAFPLWRQLDPASDPSAGASLSGLALLGWVALAGLPRSERSQRWPGQSEPGPGAGAWTVVGLALPAAALAAALDVGAGLAPLEAARTAGFALALAALLAAAADRAAAPGPNAPGAGGLHAGLWLVLVPFAAVLPALAFWARPTRGALGGLVDASPLGWVARRALEAGPEPSAGPAHVPLAALGAALALLACAGWERER